MILSQTVLESDPYGLETVSEPAHKHLQAYVNKHIKILLGPKFALSVAT